MVYFVEQALQVRTTVNARTLFDLRWSEDPQQGQTLLMGGRPARGPLPPPRPASVQGCARPLIPVAVAGVAGPTVREGVSRHAERNGALPDDRACDSRNGHGPQIRKKTRCRYIHRQNSHRITSVVVV